MEKNKQTWTGNRHSYIFNGGKSKNTTKDKDGLTPRKRKMIERIKDNLTYREELDPLV